MSPWHVLTLLSHLEVDILKVYWICERIIYFILFIVSVLWREEGYTMKYILSPRESRGWSPRDFPWAQGIFHRISWLKSQYRHSQLQINQWPWIAGQYGKIYPSRLSNTGEVNFNSIMFSNWECIRIRTRGGIYGQIYPSAWRSSRGRSLRELPRSEEILKSLISVFHC